VPQDTVIFGASAAENIRFGRTDADDARVIAAAKAAEADDFILAQAQGYDTYLGEKGVRLSGGQQQRIAIAARAAQGRADPAARRGHQHLDAQSEASIQHALERLMRGRTTLVIAHRLATVQKADRIVVMDGGTHRRTRHACRVAAPGWPVLRTGAAAVRCLTDRNSLAVTGSPDEFLLELIFEFFLQAIVENPRRVRQCIPWPPPFRRNATSGVAAIGYGFFGAIIGALSLIPFPRSMRSVPATCAC